MIFKFEEELVYINSNSTDFIDGLIFMTYGSPDFADFRDGLVFTTHDSFDLSHNYKVISKALRKVSI